MTIIVASTNGKEIYFAYDTATSNGLFLKTIDSGSKVKPIGRGNVAMGLAGYVFAGFSIFDEELASRGQDHPIDVISQFLAKYPDTRNHVSILMGVLDNGTTRLLACDRGTEFLLREVQAYGIGSGMYPEVVVKLLGKHCQDTRTHLAETVGFAKELDRKRDKVLFGFGESRLGLEGFEELSYSSAFKESLEAILHRKLF